MKRFLQNLFHSGKNKSLQKKIDRNYSCRFLFYDKYLLNDNIASFIRFFSSCAVCMEEGYRYNTVCRTYIAFGIGFVFGPNLIFQRS